MRRFIYSLLMVLMLTPSLACAMQICAVEAGAHSPCGHEHDADQHSMHHKDKVRFAADCMGVDLQKVDYSTINQPDLSKLLSFALVPETVVLADRIAFSTVKPIRGPPEFALADPPVILTTQRFRI